MKDTHDGVVRSRDGWSHQERTLGVTVIGDYIVSEGVMRVLDNLQHAGVRAVACSPTVSTPAAEGKGTFAPPDDAGSSPRRFDRPLFGRHALWLTTAPSYHPDPRHYAGCAYGPAGVSPLTREHGELIGRFIDEALSRGMKVYLQVAAACPPALRDEDRPRLPDGRVPPGRLADTASLASDAVRNYNRAWARDLVDHYPQVTGFRIDWPEYPCYTIGEAFQDFGPHVARWASEHGHLFDTSRQAAGKFYDHLHGNLTNKDLESVAGQYMHHGTACPMAVAVLLRHEPLAEWLRIKAALCTDFIGQWRRAISDCDDSKELIAHAFMPPYATLTGFDFAGVGQHCDVIAPKLYTMHWSLMVKFWADHLLAHNHGLDEQLLVRVLVQMMDLADAETTCPSIADYGYPEPHEPHPIPAEPHRRKLWQAMASARVGRPTPVGPMVHGYGPVEDVLQRFRIAVESDCPIVWITRYGYLGDEKLSGIRDVWRTAVGQ